MDIAPRLENRILRETIDSITDKLGPRLDDIAIERIVIGIFFIAVKLTDGHGGLCFTPIKMLPEAVCCPSSAKAMPDSGKLAGMPVAKVLGGMFSGNVLRRAIGIAVANALTNSVLAAGYPHDYRIEHDSDPLDGYPLSESTQAVVVGALVPYIRQFASHGCRFSILEKDPATLKPRELEHFVPKDRAAAAIAAADLLVITGTTLINGTLEGILDQARPGADIVVVGPTASLLPEAFFARGVTAVGGVMATSPDRLLDVVAEGGSGYHFFGTAADRVVFRRR